MIGIGGIGVVHLIILTLMTIYFYRFCIQEHILLEKAQVDNHETNNGYSSSKCKDSSSSWIRKEPRDIHSGEDIEMIFLFDCCVFCIVSHLWLFQSTRISFLSLSWHWRKDIYHSFQAQNYIQRSVYQEKNGTLPRKRLTGK